MENLRPLMDKQNAMTTHEPLDPSRQELVVERAMPYTIIGATSAWLHATGYSEREAAGRSVSMLQGEGTCVVTLGALWSAMQVCDMLTLAACLSTHPQPCSA